MRAASDALESDLVYERYLGQAGLLVSVGATHGARVRHGRRISGEAPLFERFSLGDSRTLRGWNKYDIAPAGGDRMFHASVEYRYRGLAMFLDAGSVWDRDTERSNPLWRPASASTLVPCSSRWAFPLNTDEFRAVFTMGIRFSGVGYEASRSTDGGPAAATIDRRPRRAGSLGVRRRWSSSC